MQHFRLVKADIDTGEILQEVQRHRDAWLLETGRQQRAVAQQHTQAIPIRGLRRSRILGRRRRDVHESRYTGLSEKFPSTRAFLEATATELGGTVGRARLARLQPGRRVLPHVDRGDYYLDHERYHLVVCSAEGSVLCAGGEQAKLQQGELWWFDNKALHEAGNHSSLERIHLIFDLSADRPAAADIEAAQQPDPATLLGEARTHAENALTEQVGYAVRTYKAVCRQPDRWGKVLATKDRVRRAQTNPIAVLTELHWPWLGKAQRRRCASAIAWALAQLDLQRIGIDEVADAIRRAGGIETIHIAWKNSPEALLYGAEQDA